MPLLLLSALTGCVGVVVAMAAAVCHPFLSSGSVFEYPPPLPPSLPPFSCLPSSPLPPSALPTSFCMVMRWVLSTVCGTCLACTIEWCPLPQSVEGEGHDRYNITLPGFQEELIMQVATASKGPVIVVVSASLRRGCVCM
jgi:hypothetical protein